MSKSQLRRLEVQHKARIEELEKQILAMENDTACIPEDFSVTEYVLFLRAELIKAYNEIANLRGDFNVRT